MQTQELQAPHFTRRLLWASSLVGGTLGKVINLPAQGTDVEEAVEALAHRMYARLERAGNLMPNMAQRPWVGDCPGSPWGARLTSGRAVVSTTPGAVWVTTNMSVEAAVAAGVREPRDGWHSPAGQAAREVSAAADAEGWEIEGPMGLYHRGYVLRRLGAVACDLLPPAERRRLRKAARAYERAYRALKDGAL